MKLTYVPYHIYCVHPFGISRSSNIGYDVVFVYLAHEGIIGRGQAAPNRRYDEVAGDVLKILDRGLNLPQTPPEDVEALITTLVNQSGGFKALEAALSMAALDWWTQQREEPLHTFLGAEKPPNIATSFTIALGDRESLPQKIEEAGPYKILKIKLGTDDDREIIRQIRTLTDKPLRVDANEGWTLTQAQAMIPWLAEQGVELVEQPLPADRLEETAQLKAESPLPLIADENVESAEDIPNLAGAFDGINIKLMKCGSVLEARRMIDLAREHNLQVMIGCMVESSVGVTAMAQLSPLVDYADLDGHLLIDNDPYRGMTVENGMVVLPEHYGLGTTLIDTKSPGLL